MCHLPAHNMISMLLVLQSLMNFAGRVLQKTQLSNGIIHKENKPYLQIKLNHSVVKYKYMADIVLPTLTTHANESVVVNHENGSVSQ